MGLFSSKTEIYVSSSVYNLAGEYTQRSSKVFQSLVLGSIMNSSGESKSKIIHRGLVGSQASAQKRFFSWAKSNYALGMPKGYVTKNVEVSAEKVRSGLESVISLNRNQSIEIVAAVIDNADEKYIAEGWVRANRPWLEDEQWISEYNPDTAKIDISFGANLGVSIDGPPAFYEGVTNPNKRLLYIGYRIATRDLDTQVVTTGVDTLYVYSLGSGNVVFDTLQKEDSEEVPEFFPAIPLRLDNQSVADLDEFAAAKKAFRKLTNTKIETLLEQVEDNDNIDDIDFCFVVLGVSLNTQDMSAKRYLYEFFQELMTIQKSSLTFREILEGSKAQEVQQVVYDRWGNAQKSAAYTHPTFGDLAPFQSGSYIPTINRLRVVMEDLPSFDMELEWNSVNEFRRSGNAGVYEGSPGKTSVGDVVIFVDDVLLGRILNEITSRYSNVTSKILVIRHQISKMIYRELRIEGLVHVNTVYRGTKVRITVPEALDDEEESGFLIPLHRPTLKKLGTRRELQLCSANSYLLFNTYQKVKIRWYQRGLFKLILLAGSIALSVVTAGGSLALAGGVLGTNLAVGAALGVVGAAAAIAGAVANAVAAMILSMVIQKASTAIFGEKFGAIIGAIATFAGMTYASHFAATGNFNVDWGQLMNIQNLQGLTNAVTRGYGMFMQADTAALYEQMQELQESNADAMEEIQKLSEEILGMTGEQIDPNMLSDAREYFGESSETFLSRTLLTGSDLAEITHALIEDFSTISLKLPELSTSTLGFA
tara:strand:+ start:13978 stop:16269 length:2292 start_codon:yes stop_codon:yes gene_type:complete